MDKRVCVGANVVQGVNPKGTAKATLAALVAGSSKLKWKESSAEARAMALSFNSKISPKSGAAALDDDL